MSYWVPDGETARLLGRLSRLPRDHRRRIINEYVKEVRRTGFHVWHALPTPLQFLLSYYEDHEEDLAEILEEAELEEETPEDEAPLGGPRDEPQPPIPPEQADAQLRALMEGRL